MASVYKKGNKIYISWWDPILGKTQNRSTGLKYSKANMREAKKISDAIQQKLDEAKSLFERFGIKKISIESAFGRLLKNNSDKSANTISEYRRFYIRFTRSFNPQAPCTIINKLSVEDWINDIKQLPLSQNSKYCINKNLNKFLDFLFSYDYLPAFKINKDVKIKPETKPIILFTQKDINTILANLKTKNSNFRTMILTLIYSGLRPTDIFNLTVNDIDLENAVLTYYSIKTREPFIVPIHKELISVFDERIREITEERIYEYSSSKEMGKAFRRYLDKIELGGKGYNLRTFRKYFVSMAHDNGIDLATVSKLVGHKNISTTAKFYNKISISKKSFELNKLKIGGTEKE